MAHERLPDRSAWAPQRPGQTASSSGRGGALPGQGLAAPHCRGRAPARPCRRPPRRCARSGTPRRGGNGPRGRSRCRAASSAPEARVTRTPAPRGRCGTDSGPHRPRIPSRSTPDRSRIDPALTPQRFGIDPALTQRGPRFPQTLETPLDRPPRSAPHRPRTDPGAQIDPGSNSGMLARGTSRVKSQIPEARCSQPSVAPPEEAEERTGAAASASAGHPGGADARPKPRPRKPMRNAVGFLKRGVDENQNKRHSGSRWIRLRQPISVDNGMPCNFCRLKSLLHCQARLEVNTASGSRDFRVRTITCPLARRCASSLRAELVSAPQRAQLGRLDTLSHPQTFGGGGGVQHSTTRSDEKESDRHGGGEQWTQKHILQTTPCRPWGKRLPKRKGNTPSEQRRTETNTQRSTPYSRKRYRTETRAKKAAREQLQGPATSANAQKGVANCGVS